MMIPASKSAKDTQLLPPTPIFNGSNEAAELEEPIRLYIKETALHENALEAIPPSGPQGSKPHMATCFWQGPEGGI